MNKNNRNVFVVFSLIFLIGFLVQSLFFIGAYVFSNSLASIVFTSLISSIITAGIVTYTILAASPVLSSFIMTFRRLSRLDSLSHPLMLRLQHEAPATFQHSLQVGNLANRAAKAIGADSYLVRIGGYYHDIGKMIEPDLFIENSVKNVVKPEDMTLSELEQIAKNLFSHVGQGVKILSQENFPEEVIAFVPQHHGTMPIAYFYTLAKKIDPKTKKEHYFYPGPKPLTKEAAIIMIADAVESRIRSMEKIDKESVRAMIAQVIEDRAERKQFDLSGLTPTDFRKITSALATSISAVHHKRISYPGDDNK